MEAANRSLAKLERLVKEQHQQACYDHYTRSVFCTLHGAWSCYSLLVLLQLVASGVLPPDAKGGISAELWHPASFVLLSDEQKALQREVDKLAALAASIMS